MPPAVGAATLCACHKDGHQQQEERILTALPEASAKRVVLSLLWASQERNTFLPSMPVMFASSLTTEPRVIGLGEGSGGEWLVAWSLRKVGDDPTGVGGYQSRGPGHLLQGPRCQGLCVCRLLAVSLLQLLHSSSCRQWYQPPRIIVKIVQNNVFEFNNKLITCQELSFQ